MQKACQTAEGRLAGFLLYSTVSSMIYAAKRLIAEKNISREIFYRQISATGVYGGPLACD